MERALDHDGRHSIHVGLSLPRTYLILRFSQRSYFNSMVELKYRRCGCQIGRHSHRSSHETPLCMSTSAQAWQVQRCQRAGLPGWRIVPFLQVDVIDRRVARRTRKEVKLPRGRRDDGVALEAPVRRHRSRVERQRLVGCRRRLVHVEVQRCAVGAVERDRAVDGEIS